MLDTDTASYVIGKKAPEVDARFRTLNLGQLCISAVTRAELRFGSRRRPNAIKLQAGVDRFLGSIPTLPWDSFAADQFADMRADLESSGTPIGDLDTMIAAHAKSVKAILVTNNLKHFRLVKGLAVENWVER